MTGSGPGSEPIDGDRRAQILLFTYAVICVVASGFLIECWLEASRAGSGAPSRSVGMPALPGVCSVALIDLWAFNFAAAGLIAGRRGVHTLRAGVHPPPGTVSPWRTVPRSGRAAAVLGMIHLAAALALLATAGFLGYVQVAAMRGVSTI